MKILSLALLTLFVGAGARAAGGFDCTSADGKVTVSGIDSSAGTGVNKVVINGKELKEKKDYNEQLYNSDRQLSLFLLDGDLNKEILRIETVKSYPHAAGIIWLDGNKEEGQVVTCGFTY